MEPAAELAASYEIKNVVCYPYDTLMARVVIHTSGGTAPYTTNLDCGTKLADNLYQIKFKRSISCTAKFTDASNTQRSILISVDSKDYDSLQYDYRISLVGNYIGNEVSATYTLVNNIITKIESPSVNSSINVSLANKFTHILFSNCTNSSSYNYYTNLAQGQCGSTHGLSARFRSDSLLLNKAELYSSNGAITEYKLKKVN